MIGCRNLIISITILLLVNSSFQALEKKKRVILIGVDGLLQYCYNKAETSAFEKLKSEGSYTFNARTAIEAISGPGWSNILCGIDSEDSGIINNDWVPPSITRKFSPITPVTGYEPLPCIYHELKKNNADLKLKISYAWDFMLFFGNEYNPGLLDVEKYCGDYSTLETTDLCDKKTKDNTLQFIRDDFDFIFTYFGSVDETGHLSGFCSDRYVQQISTINSHINEILKEIKDQGIEDETTVIVTTDHGAELGTFSHGFQDDLNLIIPFIIKGPGIKKNFEITKTLVRNYVTPILITKAFGFESNKFWRAKIPEEIYESTKNENKTDSNSKEFLKTLE